MCVAGAFMCDTSTLDAAALVRTLPRSLRVTHIHTLVPIFSSVDSILSAHCVSAPIPPLLIPCFLPSTGLLVSAPDF